MEAFSSPFSWLQKAYSTKKAIFRTYQFFWYILGIIEVLLTFRLILKLIGANPVSGFTNLIYTLSAPFAAPFIGIVSQSVTGGSASFLSFFQNLFLQRPTQTILFP